MTEEQANFILSELEALKRRVVKLEETLEEVQYETSTIKEKVSTMED